MTGALSAIGIGTAAAAGAETVSAGVIAGDLAATAGGAAAASAGGAAAASGLSLSTIAAGASLASAGIGALGSIEQSRAQSAAAGYNAKVAAQNAQIATTNANFAGAEGEQNVAAEGAKTKAALAATLANQGASGVDVNTGSAVDVRESEAKLGMLNALTVRSNAAKQAYGFQVSAASDTGTAALQRSQQKYDITSGYLNAGSTVLGGVGNAAKYTTYLNQNGLTP